MELNARHWLRGRHRPRSHAHAARGGRPARRAASPTASSTPRPASARRRCCSGSPPPCATLMRDADAPDAAADRRWAAGAPGAVDCDTGIVVLRPQPQGLVERPHARHPRARAGRARAWWRTTSTWPSSASAGRARPAATTPAPSSSWAPASAPGILIDGELHRGHSFMAGEIAVMCMGPQYVDVDYGTRGVPGDAGRPAGAGRALAAGRQGRSRGVDGRRCSRPREAGDRAARRAVDETATLIGIAVANVAAVLDPSLIVLGGALMAQGGPLVRGGAQGGGADRARARRDRRLRAGQGRAAVRLPAGGGHGGAHAGAAAARRGPGREMKERAMRMAWRMRWRARSSWRSWSRPRRRRAAAPARPCRSGSAIPASARLLILHADDLGMSRSVNRATLRGPGEGLDHLGQRARPLPVVPGRGAVGAGASRGRPRASTSRSTASGRATAGARSARATRSRACSTPTATCRSWRRRWWRSARPAEVEAELRAQIDRARAAGLRISHLDSHMATLFRTPGAVRDLPPAGRRLRRARPARAHRRARRRGLGVGGRPAGGRPGGPRGLHRPRA